MAMTARPYEGLNSVSRLFGAESEPSFFDADKMEEYWGGHWGVNSEYGKLKVVYMHRPGDELTTMKPEHYDAQRDALIGPEYCYYWRGKEAPNIPKAQAQHDYFTDVLRSYGVEVVYTKNNPITLRKTVNTKRCSRHAVPGGVIIMRLAPHMRRGEELLATKTAWCKRRTDSAYHYRYRCFGRRRGIDDGFSSCSSCAVTSLYGCRYYTA